MMVNVGKFAEENFQYFKEVYDSEQEMLDYWRKFSQTPKSTNSTTEEFYSISLFYKNMKLAKDDFTKTNYGNISHREIEFSKKP
jgi:hypothetical protein